MRRAQAMLALATAFAMGGCLVAGDEGSAVRTALWLISLLIREIQGKYHFSVLIFAPEAAKFPTFPRFMIQIACRSNREFLSR